MVKNLLDINVTLDKIETPQIAGVKILHFTSKKENIEIIFDCPIRLLNLIELTKTQEVNLKIGKKDVNEEDIKVKAAKEISHEIKEQPKKIEKKKNVKTIEDAIDKAVEEEKKVMVLDK